MGNFLSNNKKQNIDRVCFQCFRLGNSCEISYLYCSDPYTIGGDNNSFVDRCYSCSSGHTFTTSVDLKTHERLKKMEGKISTITHSLHYPISKNTDLDTDL